jgi:hypothetical protein
MRQLRLLAFVVALLPGCGGQDGSEWPCHDLHCSIELSPEFTEDETEAIAAAVSEWELATAGGVSVSLVAYAGDIDVRLAQAGELANESHGRYDPWLSAIMLDREALVSAEDYRHVMLHELGHAFGLEHSDAGLMMPEAGGCIDAETLRQFCWIHLCDGDEGTTCSAQNVSTHVGVPPRRDL